MMAPTQPTAAILGNQGGLFLFMSDLFALDNIPLTSTVRPLT